MAHFQYCDLTVAYSLGRYESRNHDAKPFNLKTVKHFMEAVIHGCIKSNAKKKPSMYTMLQRWIDFGAGWKRRSNNSKIPSKVLESVYFVHVLIFPYLLRSAAATV